VTHLQPATFNVDVSLYQAAAGKWCDTNFRPGSKTKQIEQNKGKWLTGISKREMAVKTS